MLLTGYCLRLVFLYIYCYVITVIVQMKGLQEISNFCNNIIQVFLTAVIDCVPNIKSHCSQQIPGWNEYVKDSHSVARDAFHIWLIISKPRQGDIYKHMKFSQSFQI